MYQIPPYDTATRRQAEEVVLGTINEMIRELQNFELWRAMHITARNNLLRPEDHTYTITEAIRAAEVWRTLDVAASLAIWRAHVNAYDHGMWEAEASQAGNVLQRELN